MAMALVGRFLATVFRREICVFALDNPARLVQHLTFDYAACFASITPYPAPLTSFASSSSDSDSVSSMRRTTFVVALSTLSGVRAYHVRLDTAEHFDLQFIWEHRTPKVEGIDLIEPIVDVNGRCVTWLEISLFHLRRQHCFCVTSLPSPFANADATLSALDSEPPFCSKLDDPRLPALYFATTGDYDRRRGLAVFGNSYGELVVCDFNKTSGEVPSYNNDVDIQIPLLMDGEVTCSVVRMYLSFDETLALRSITSDLSVLIRSGPTRS